MTTHVKYQHQEDHITGERLPCVIPTSVFECTAIHTADGDHKLFKSKYTWTDLPLDVHHVDNEALTSAINYTMEQLSREIADAVEKAIIRLEGKLPDRAATIGHLRAAHLEDGSILYTWKNQLIVVVTPPEWAADRRWRIHTI